MPRVPTSIPASSGVPSGRSNAPAGTTRRGTSQSREQFASRGLNQAQDNARAATAAASALPFGDGNLVVGVSMGANTPQQIAHGLGALWRGYLPLNVQGGMAAFRATPAPTTDGATITLTSNVSCTLDLWVYR